MQDAVDRQWQWLLAERGGLAPEVNRMIAAAASRPELRRLFPYLSLEHYLHFSFTTEWPYTEGLPFLRYVDPNSVLDGPAFELRGGDAAPLARGDLQQLIDRLVDLMPFS